MGTSISMGPSLTKYRDLNQIQLHVHVVNSSWPGVAYIRREKQLISLVTHICVTDPSISLIGPEGDLQNSVRPR